MEGAPETRSSTQAEDCILFLRAFATDLGIEERRTVEPTIQDLLILLDDITEVVGWPVERARKESPHPRPSRGTGLDVFASTIKIRRIRLESPLEIAVQVSQTVIESASALGLLIFLVRQL